MEEKSERRWRDAQSKEDAFWKREGVFGPQMERILSRYAAVIAEVSQHLPPEASILEVGCGPTCAARLFPHGSRIYLDPLMVSFARTYGRGLPEGGKICGVGESIPLREASFDVVICLNALDHMRDPLKALAEVRRVLKEEGVFVLGVFLHSPLVAFARTVIEKRLPFFREEAHPHSYTLGSVREALERFFCVRREIRLFRKESALIPSLHREDWAFVCTKK